MDINSLGYGWRMIKGGKSVGYGTFQAQPDLEVEGDAV